jgi:hypothetical protein
MQDFVSTRWIRAAGVVASISVVWAMFIPNGLFWIGFVLLVVSLGVGLAVSIARGLEANAPRSMAQVIDDVEAEPLLAFATAPAPRPAPKAVR